MTSISRPSGMVSIQQRQVVPHRPLEETHVLGDDADLSPQLRGAGVPDVMSTQQHAASVGVVEAEEPAS